ncbi:MAG: ParB/RepB/Spo0J family partition protein [Legionella sp.]|nr:ParB/RepB/Spo0J family partition protein [Legionella sp.]
MKNDPRKQAVLGVVMKDNTTDWKNIATREIEENKTLKQRLDNLTQELAHKDTTEIIGIDPKVCRNWQYADRHNFELGDIEALAEDIQRNGQLQPAIVRKIESPVYTYEIIAGERRWRACLSLQMPLKATVTQEDDAGCLVIQTSENKQQSVSPYSLAITYEKVIKTLGISQNELARRLNIPKTSFSELLSFNKVPEAVWHAVEDMTLVKPKTAAFLAQLCAKGEEYLEAITKLAEKIRLGTGADNLLKFVDAMISGNTAKRKMPAVYQTTQGEILFRMTEAGKISLSKFALKKVDLSKLATYLSEYLEETV